MTETDTSTFDDTQTDDTPTEDTQPDDAASSDQSSEDTGGDASSEDSSADETQQDTTDSGDTSDTSEAEQTTDSGDASDATDATEPTDSSETGETSDSSDPSDSSDSSHSSDMSDASGTASPDGEQVAMADTGDGGDAGAGGSDSGAGGSGAAGADAGTSSSASGGSTPPAPAAHVPARAMSKADAYAELVRLHNAGALKLNPAPAAKAPATPPTWVNFATSSMNGVEFKYWTGSAVVRHVLETIDPRHGVALARLADWAKTNYGVTVIYHLGIGGDSTKTRVDCHGQGRALDFAGVQGTGSNGMTFDWQVLRDWGKKTVPDLKNPSGPRLASWPPVSGVIAFREATGPDAGTAYATFFHALYNFAADEWQDKDDKPSASTTPTAIGDHTFMMNPDHPTSAAGTPHGREAHQNHLHVQIGKTGTE